MERECISSVKQLEHLKKREKQIRGCRPAAALAHQFFKNGIARPEVIRTGRRHHCRSDYEREPRSLVPQQSPVSRVQAKGWSHSAGKSAVADGVGSCLQGLASPQSIQGRELRILLKEPLPGKGDTMDRLRSRGHTGETMSLRTPHG